MKSRVLIAYSALFLMPILAQADGSAIDKVYHPYVQPLEKEVEWRMIIAEGDSLQKLSYGQSLTDRLYVEAYLTATEDNDNFRLNSYELEAKWQLTEQGEYAIDWGVVTELEKSNIHDQWEAATALLMEKQWGRWIGAANFWLEYEWGDDIEEEFETALSMQARYRMSAKFEPAIEFYGGAETRALGPVALGDVRFSAGKKLHWEAGVLFGVGKQSPDATLRFLTEFEF